MPTSNFPGITNNETTFAKEEQVEVKSTKSMNLF